MNASDFCTNQQYPNKKPIISMTSRMRSTISSIYNTVSAPAAATRATLAERLQSVRETVSLLYNKTVDNIEHGRERLKDIVEKEGREEEEDNIDLTATEKERALKGAYRNFLIHGTPKADIDSFLIEPKRISRR